MKLTDEQAEVARALGCRFIPATEAQVRQFSMQRRVFTIGDAPFLAARQDGFYETAGTLLALIAGAMRDRRAPPSPAPEPGPPEPVARKPLMPAVAQAEAVPGGSQDEKTEAPPPPAVAPPVAGATSSRPAAPVMAATVTIVKGYARRGSLDTGTLTALVASVHQTLRRLG